MKFLPTVMIDIAIYRITRLDQKFFWVETIRIGNIRMVETKVPKRAEKALTIP